MVLALFTEYRFIWQRTWEFHSLHSKTGTWECKITKQSC